MQGIVENRKFRTFPWPRKPFGKKKLRARLRARSYKRGRIWKAPDRRGWHNLQSMLRQGRMDEKDGIKE